MRSDISIFTSVPYVIKILLLLIDDKNRTGCKYNVFAFRLTGISVNLSSNTD